MPSLIKCANFFFFCFLLCFITSCSKESINGSGDAKQEIRPIKTFTGISIDGNYDILGKIDKPEPLRISSNVNILPHILSTIDDDILTIKNDDEVELHPTVTQNIWFSTESLQTIRLSGDIQFEMHHLDNEKLDCSFNGSNKIFLEGKTNDLKVIVNGNANVNAQNLQVKNAEVEINGSGIVALTVADNLKVTINGDGKVIYYNGQPKIEQKIQGAGQVKSAFGALEQAQ